MSEGSGVRKTVQDIFELEEASEVISLGLSHRSTWNENVIQFHEIFGKNFAWEFCFLLAELLLEAIGEEKFLELKKNAGFLPNTCHFNLLVDFQNVPIFPYNF